MQKKRVVLFITAVLIQQCWGRCGLLGQNISPGFGYINSPNYPDVYPRNTQCTCRFGKDTRGSHLIVLKMEDIMLHYETFCTASLTIQYEITSSLAVTSSSPLPETKNHVIAIIMSVLVTILIIVGILILIVLQRRRSTPTSAEEFFGTSRGKDCPGNGLSNYDVIYRPNKSPNAYETVGISGKQEDGEHIYFQLDSDHETGQLEQTDSANNQLDEDTYDHLNQSVDQNPGTLASNHSEEEKSSGRQVNENVYEQVCQSDNQNPPKNQCSTHFEPLYDEVYEPSSIPPYDRGMENRAFQHESTQENSDPAVTQELTGKVKTAEEQVPTLGENGYTEVVFKSQRNKNHV